MLVRQYAQYLAPPEHPYGLRKRSVSVQHPVAPGAAYAGRHGAELGSVAVAGDHGKLAADIAYSAAQKLPVAEMGGQDDDSLSLRGSLHQVLLAPDLDVYGTGTLLAHPEKHLGFVDKVDDAFPHDAIPFPAVQAVAEGHRQIAPGCSYPSPVQQKKEPGERLGSLHHPLRVGTYYPAVKPEKEKVARLVDNAFTEFAHG